jgi:hypothetical protein
MVEHSPFTIVARGTHLIGETRSTDELIVEGVIEGDVVGAKVVIKNGGRVIGTIDCETLVIEPGGILDGNIRSTGFQDKRRKGQTKRRRLLGGQAKGVLPPPEDQDVTGDDDRYQV